MGFALAAEDDSEAQDFRNYIAGIAGAVDAMVGELVRGQALGIERAEALFIAEERAAGHGHAAGEQQGGRRVEPENGNAGGAEKFRASGLRVSAAAESEDRAGPVLCGAADGRAEMLRFELAKSGFAEAGKEIRDGEIGRA